ncbi:NlpC/P60 family protein [Synechococcus sp. PCC 7335]|uniref:C40 family peptidase n=1 Tax=Synechococcus sp. (strain ATCC 29403 / PCC 7335) TaxID=91464 RepID=UPI00017EE768|nr:C40 family peptidase [Synechococcus sp. PCC 7335]EDX84598.1 NlpC/P60 family protein [Synechococcus sp. PCC 7335]
MVTLEALQDGIYRGAVQQYVCSQAVNLYQSPTCQGLVTQVDVGDHLRILEVSKDHRVFRVCSCKDDYPGWIAAEHLHHLTPATQPYRAPVLSTDEIRGQVGKAIAFAKAAMATPNEYLWGGTTAPNYDCSGLVQSAFAFAGIQLPRDSFQQEDFTERVTREELQPGDLVFFGTPVRTTHVGLYLGEGRYIHSSGKDKGRNGIGIDSLIELSDPVSRGYYDLLRCYGRVTRSYQPSGRRERERIKKSIKMKHN